MTMYNRYVPQPDGTYRKNRLQEPVPPEPPRKQRPPTPTPPPSQCPPPVVQENYPPPRPTTKPHRRNEADTLTGFFKHLLPKELETADLLIILLILLMAGDCEEDRNNALLTLALYFFL